MVENELSRLVLGGKVNPGDRIGVQALDGELHFDVEREVAESRKEEAAQPVPAGS